MYHAKFDDSGSFLAAIIGSVILGIVLGIAFKSIILGILTAVGIFCSVASICFLVEECYDKLKCLIEESRPT